MKLLLDQNLSVDLLPAIKDLYAGIEHIRTVGLTNALDRTVWRWAKAHGYAICSKDGDFYNWVMSEAPPKFIWIRIGNCSFNDSVKLFRQNYALIRAFIDDPQQSALILTKNHLI